MSDKIIAWFANLALACVLVFVAVHQKTYAQSESLSIEITGTAVLQTVGDLQISPARLDTGLIDIGQSTTQMVQLKHVGASGAEPVQINGAGLLGGHTSEFTTDFAGYVTLNPGDAIDVSITFTPMIPGDKSGGLRMDVAGAGAPHVVIMEGKARYPLSSDLESDNNTVNLGQAVQNAVKKANITLTNTATEAEAPIINLIGNQMLGDTPQAFGTNIAGAALAPGESVTFEVVMQDAGIGFKSAILEILHDGNNPAVEIVLEGDVVAPAAVPVNFGQDTLNGTNLARPTSLQFGPDGHLYVTEMDGLIKEYIVTRNGKNNYTANQAGVINAIANTQNHNDDGSPNNTKKRLVTGILVVGSAAQPEIYVQSSDWRQGGGPSGNDTNLDTNSGILHKLVKNGNGWTKHDLVRGLPRSEENHHGNGMVMMGNKLLMAMGGTTNQGLPSNNFAGMTETALSAAILEFDLGAIGNGTYDLPTIDDPDQPGPNDNNDPFGGNNGKNQAKLVAGGPVQVYSPGYRNAYDLVLAQSGNLYVTDNGPNAGWGGFPTNGCGNNFTNGGQTFIDQLHHVPHKGYYAGHPNPVRGDKNNTFNPGNPESPVEVAANPEECNYKSPNNDGSIATFPASTNGIAEYTASNFGSAMAGDLLLTGFDKAIYRVSLNAQGNGVASKPKLVNGIGSSPLDVVAQGDGDIFPGTIWMVDNITNNVYVFEPADYE